MYSRKLLLKLLLTFLFTEALVSQSLTNERALEFIRALINNNDSLKTFVLPEELALSKRLGITYEGIKNKFLISYEIPNQIAEEIKNKKEAYIYKIEKIDSEFSILHFDANGKNYKTEYYFKSGYLISPPYFYYKDWQRIQSDHFIFYVSDPKSFNQYSIERLENFVNNIFSILKFNEEEKQILKEEKLIYILCKNEDEIEKLTGYKARGMGNLAYDYVITTYNCHYHELLHILINYKLKKLPLYTHPFLQEGFAVAFGGRGGYEPGVILNLGKFLKESEFLKVKQLFSADEYKTCDVSMTYPLSGLYNLFLFNNTGIEKYLHIYLKYSLMDISGLVIKQDELPSELDWDDYVKNFTNDQLVSVDFPEENFKTLAEDSSYFIKENNDFYFLETKDDILISISYEEKGYISKKFNELYPDKLYNRKKYLVRVNDSEVAVYNLFTNNLIANYVSGFSVDIKPVPNKNGFYKFAVQKKIFDEEPNNWTIKTIEGK